MLNPEMQYNDYIAHLFPEYDGRGIKEVTFQLTDNCNLCCSYCYQIQKGHHKMPFEVAKKFIDYMFEGREDPTSEFYEGNVIGFIIEFIGGEPLLEAHLMEQICDYFESKLAEVPESPWNLFHIYSISSNGTLYNTKACQHFLKKYDGLISLGITVDGCKELHDKCRLFANGSGSYDLAVSAALDVMKRIGNRSTKLTFSPANLDYVFEGFKNMAELGFKDLYGNCVFEDVWNNKEDIIKYYNQLKMLVDWLLSSGKINDVYIRIFESSGYNAYKPEDGDRQWCGTTTNMFAIDYKGDIYSCLRFMESSLGNDAPPLIIGNVDRGIGILKSEQEIMKLFDNYNKKNIYTDRCFNCPIESGCSWCAACSYQITGNLKCRTMTTCEIHKAEYLATLHLYKKSDKNIWAEMPKVDYEFVKNIISQEEYNFLTKEE